jgi:hypothetical protein
MNEIGTDEKTKTLMELGKALSSWRSRRRRGERIPRKLWDGATEAAVRYGSELVSERLDLDYRRLKERVSKSASEGLESSASVFVELNAEGLSSGSACVVELEKGNGCRLRISLSASTGVDWCRIKEAFLEA